MRQLLVALAFAGAIAPAALGRDIPLPPSVERFELAVAIPPHDGCPVAVALDMLVVVGGVQPVEVSVLLGERDLLTSFVVDRLASGEPTGATVNLTIRESTDSFVWVAGGGKSSTRLPLVVTC